MKYLPLFVTGALAVLPELPNALLERDAGSLVGDIAAIDAAAMALDSAIKGYNGGDAGGVVAAVGAVNQALTQGAKDASAAGTLASAQAVVLVSPVSNLASEVTVAVSDVISKKPVFTSAGLGGEVEDQLSTLYSNAVAFANALLSDIPSGLQSVGSPLAASITNELQSAVSAYSGLGGSSPASASATTTGGSSAASAASGSASAASTVSSVSTSESESTTIPVSTSITGTTLSVSATTTNPTTPSGTNAANNVAVGLSGAAAAAFAVVALAL